MFIVLLFGFGLMLSGTVTAADAESGGAPKPRARPAIIDVSDASPHPVVTMV